MPARLDVVHAVLLTTAIIVITAGIARWHPGRQHLDLLGYAWLAAGGLPLLWRRRWPLAVFVVSSVAVLSYYHSHYPGGPSLLAPTLALATLTFLREHNRSRGPAPGRGGGRRPEGGPA